MQKTKGFLLLSSCLLYCFYLYAQDPSLPSVNFGLTNLEAGKTRPPGLYYLQHLQMYQAHTVRDESGNVLTDAPRSNYTISLHQVLFVSHTRLLKGYLGGNALLPFARFTSVSKESQRINPNPTGDAAIGVFVQWYDRKLWGLDLSFQVGQNVVFPSGSFHQRYDVNPGTHRYRYLSHFEFTLVPFKRFAVSAKNNLYFYSKELSSPNRLGAAYNLNYALEYKITKSLTAEAAGYCLSQLEQDSYDGNKHYYRDRYGIEDTREQVIGTGGGFGFTTAHQTSVELKAMWEATAKNRSQGFRGTLVLSFPLDGKK